jgi:hypothetical protein
MCATTKPFGTYAFMAAWTLKMALVEVEGLLNARARIRTF